MKIVLLFAAALAVVSATPFYFGGSNEEVVYKYYADVRNEVYDPTSFASQFMMRGDLHIRRDQGGNGSVFWLKNVDIYAYNGENFHTFDQITEWTPLPKQAEAYLTPFYVGYYENGLVDGIHFQPNTPEWVHNIQRGIASIFQLDFAHVKSSTREVPFAFEIYESSIYGNNSVSYEVVPTKDEYTITKYQDPTQAEDFPDQKYGNMLGMPISEVSHDSSYRTVSEREYHLSREGVIRFLKSYNRVIYYPKSHNNVQYVTVLQKFKFVEFIKPSDFAVDFASFKLYSPLLFVQPSVNDHSFAPDYTFGYYQLDLEHNVKRVKDIFYEAVEYLETLQVNTEVPDNRNVKQGQAINRIVTILRYFDVDQFQKVYDFFAGDNERNVMARTLFYRVLPNVGTRPAVLFIRNLINNGKITGFEAAQLMYTLGTNFLAPTEKILDEFDFFLHFDKQRPEVRSAAILTYATMIYKVFRYQPHSPAVEKYIKLYYSGLQSAVDYEDRLVWLQGLGNIRVGSVYQLLHPIVMGEQVLKTPYDSYLRVHAIWQSIYAVKYAEADAFEAFWPVLTDEHLDIDLRLAALKGVLKTGTFAELKYLFQYIRGQKNMHLMNYFYTFVHSVAKSGTHIDSYFHIVEFARQAEEYFNRPASAVNTYAFFSDYTDEEYGVGYVVAGNVLANETSNQINQVFYSINTLNTDKYFNNFNVYLRFNGIDFPLYNFLEDIYTFDINVWRTKFLQRTGEPIHIEMIFTFHDQVFFVRYFNEANLNALFGELFQFVNLIKYQYTGVFYSVQEYHNIPTDFGFAAHFYFQLPFVFQFRFEPLVFQADASNVRFKYQWYVSIWSHAVKGITVYNPLSSSFQGTRRVLSYDLNSPFNLDIAVDFKQQTLRLSKFVDDRPLYNTVGNKFHALTQVYTLSERANNFSQYVIATNKKPEFRAKQDLLGVHSRYFGRYIYLGVFDYEYSPFDFNSHGFERDLVNFGELFEDFGKVDFRAYLLGIHNWFIKQSYLKESGSFGIVFFHRPCEQYPVDEWTFTAHPVRERVNKFVGIPDYHYNINATIQTRYNGNLVTEYFFNTEYQHLNGRTFNYWNFHFWRHVAESNRREHLYIVRDMDYHDELIEGQYRLYYGKSYDDKPVMHKFQLTADFRAERSEEQQADYVYHSDEYTYNECMSPFPWMKNYTTTYECLLAHASLREYHFFFNYKNFEKLPAEFQGYFEYLWHFLLTTHKPSYRPTPLSLVGENSFALEYVYPIGSYETEVYATVTFPGESYVFNEFPLSRFYWFDQMEYLHFPEYFRYAHDFGYYNVCEVHAVEPKHHMPHYHIADYPTEQWQLYAANKVSNYSWAVYVQRAGKNQIAARFVIGKQWFVVRPVEEDDVELYGKHRYQFTTSNEGLEYVTGLTQDAFGLQIFYARDTVVFVFPEQGIVYTFNGYTVRIANYNESHNYVGNCYVH
jgi:GC-rich sequence DNA-binding factor